MQRLVPATRRLARAQAPRSETAKGESVARAACVLRTASRRASAPRRHAPVRPHATTARQPALPSEPSPLPSHLRTGISDEIECQGTQTPAHPGGGPSKAYARESPAPVLQAEEGSHRRNSCVLQYSGFMRRTPPEGARLRLTSPTLYILKHLVGRRAGPGRWSYHWRSHCHRPGTRTGDGHSFTPLLHAQASGGLGTSGPMSALLLRRRSRGRGCNAGSTPPLASDPNWNAGARIFTSLGSTCFSVRPSGFSESRADVSRKHLLAHAALSPPPKALPAVSLCLSPCLWVGAPGRLRRAPSLPGPLRCAAVSGRSACPALPSPRDTTTAPTAVCGLRT